MKTVISRIIVIALFCAQEVLTLKSGDHERFQFQDKVLVEKIPFPGSITVYVEGNSLPTRQLQCTFSVFKNYTEWKNNMKEIKCRGTRILGLSTKHSGDHWKMTTNKKDDATDARIILERVKTNAALKLDYLIIACCLIQENVKSHDPAILCLVALPEVYYPLDIGSITNKERNYAQPHLIEIAPCPCDITMNNCDTFCCCDQDCLAVLQDTFYCFSGWYGGQRTEPFKNKNCSNYLEHVDPVMCVYIANSAFLGYFYLDVPKIEDEASFSSIASDTTDTKEIFIKSHMNEYEKGRHSGTYQRHPQKNVTKPIYHYGDKIQVISNYTSVPKSAEWYFPVSIYDGSCTLTYPLHFLINLHSLCNVQAENICKQEIPLLDARTFVTEALVLLQGPGSSVPVQTNVTYLCAKNIAAYTRYNSINISAFSEIAPCVPPVQPPSPKYHSGTCHDVVLEVRYDLLWKNGNILLRNTTIILGDILILNRRNTFWNNISIPILTQHFSVEFHYLMNITNSSFEALPIHERHIESETHVKLRSGNPGYEIGFPVISAVEDHINSTDVFKVGSHLNLWNPDAEGRCEEAGRHPVLFGINSISGCSIQINSSQLKGSCEKLESRLFDVLDSLIPAQYLSKGGNPDTESLDDFLPLFKKNLAFRKTLHNETEYSFSNCHNLPNQIHLEIAYAETGQINYTPVMEIIGALVRFRTMSKTPRCSPESSECESITFPLTSSVQFIRVSLTKEPRIKRYWYLGEVTYCNRETCWEEMFYPFTNAFTADSVYEVFFWTSSLLLAAPLIVIIFKAV